MDYFGNHLGHDYSVMVVDNRGTGMSNFEQYGLGPYLSEDGSVTNGRKPWIWGIPTMARDVYECIEDAGWADISIHIVTISMGSLIAQHMIAKTPVKVESVSFLRIQLTIESNSLYSKI